MKVAFAVFSLLDSGVRFVSVLRSTSDSSFGYFEDPLGLLDWCFSLTICLVVAESDMPYCMVTQYLKFRRGELWILVTDYLISVSVSMSFDLQEDCWSDSAVVLCDYEVFVLKLEQIGCYFGPQQVRGIVIYQRSDDAARVTFADRVTNFFLPSYLGNTSFPGSSHRGFNVLVAGIQLKHHVFA